ncbi:MAG: ribonuclease D [Deltaproteobacteria bacterium]|nr:ribonuclease D [Deltaproteobacteria bacterium]
MNNDRIWVDNDLKILNAKKHITNAPLICLDTEYDSFRYFREKLCLIQIKAQERIYLIDPLEDLNMDCLGDVFANFGIVKIMHAGDNDIRILKRDYGFEFSNIFDTQRAASILGSQYLSLSAVIHQYLGIEFTKKKKLQRSQWGKRPLSEEQLQYAVQDTMFLEPLYKILRQEIHRKGRHSDLQKIFNEMTEVTWHEKPLDCKSFRKIRKNGCLSASQLQCLKELYEWRYGKAKELNRAIFMILSDQDLLNICKNNPCTLEDLTAKGKLPPHKIKDYGSEIVAIINRDRSACSFED